jgi:hypothetical protein
MCLDKRKFLQYSDYSELSKSKEEKSVENPKTQNTKKKENNAKWTKVQNKKEGLNVPKITVQDYMLTPRFIVTWNVYPDSCATSRITVRFNTNLIIR